MNLGLNKFYDDSIDPESPKDDQKTYLLLRCDYILLKLKKHNNKLYQHFIDVQLSAEVILQRWLKCIFTREFTTEDCIYIWDNILANEFNLPSKNLEYIDYFCVAMFDYISENLLQHDQNECFLCLFKYPPFQTIDILITKAEEVKANILKLDAPKESMFSNFKNKFMEKINIPNIFNRNKGDKVDEEQRKEDILAELKKLPDNKSRIKQLKTILGKYRSKFYDDDKMKIDMILNTLEKSV
jgi:TBC1 domain family protein 5